jgi:hypothetical protein
MVSVDHLESSAAGFISQLKGKMTRRRYKAATIFVDNFSRMSYVHLQESLTSADTVEAKEAFEAFSRNMGGGYSIIMLITAGLQTMAS